jgi:hypothetical protein
MALTAASMRFSRRASACWLHHALTSAAIGCPPIHGAQGREPRAPSSGSRPLWGLLQILNTPHLMAELISDCSSARLGAAQQPLPPQRRAIGRHTACQQARKCVIMDSAPGRRKGPTRRPCSFKVPYAMCHL